MGDYIFNIVLILVFAYEAFKLFTKKNGGSDRMLEKYTEESLARYSMIAGVLMVLITIYELIELLHKMGVLHFIPLDDKGTFPITITLPCLGGFIILYLILYFVIPKKRDDYVASGKSGKNNSSDDEDY